MRAQASGEEAHLRNEGFESIHVVFSACLRQAKINTALLITEGREAGTLAALHAERASGYE